MTWMLLNYSYWCPKKKVDNELEMYSQTKCPGCHMGHLEVTQRVPESPESVFHLSIGISEWLEEPKMVVRGVVRNCFQEGNYP